MTKISGLYRRWAKDADDMDAYDALGEEFDLARAAGVPAAHVVQSANRPRR